MAVRKLDWYGIGVASFAAIGTFLFVCQPHPLLDQRAMLTVPKGFDSGLVTTTIAHQSWKDYFGHPTTSQTGAVNSTYTTE